MMTKGLLNTIYLCLFILLLVATAWFTGTSRAATTGQTANNPYAQALQQAQAQATLRNQQKNQQILQQVTTSLNPSPPPPPAASPNQPAGLSQPTNNSWANPNNPWANVPNPWAPSGSANKGNTVQPAIGVTNPVGAVPGTNAGGNNNAGNNAATVSGPPNIFAPPAPNNAR